MTTAVDPGYIRWVSVQSPRSPASGRRQPQSILDGTNYVIERPRPRTANDITSAARPQADRILTRERTAMLDELMFLYGRGVHSSFNFSKPRPSTATFKTRSSTQLTKSTGTSWQHTNNACLQMYRSSTQLPRHRIFPRLNILPTNTNTNFHTNTAVHRRRQMHSQGTNPSHPSTLKTTQDNTTITTTASNNNNNNNNNRKTDTNGT